MAVATKRVRALHQRRADRGGAARPATLTEPATGAPLATRRDGRRGGRRPRRRGRPRRRSTAPWGKTPPNERSRLLHALADAIVANRKELAELESRNVGKAISSVKAEVARRGRELPLLRAPRSRSIAGRSNPIGGSLLFYSLKEPVGVAAQIVPWNYPLMMTTWKLAPALAAGCTVVLKPDSATPLSALRIGRARGRGRLPGRRDQRRPRGRARRRARTSSRTRASTRSRSRARPRRAARSCGICLGARSSASRSSSAARARTSSSPTRISTTRSRARSGRSTTRPARAARRARASSSRSRSTTSSSPVRRAAGSLKVGDPLDAGDAGGLAHLAPSTATRCTASSRRGARRAPRSSRRRGAGRRGRVLPADGARRGRTAR